MTKVELMIEPVSAAVCYLNFSVIPRIGETVMISDENLDTDWEIGTCKAIVTGVEYWVLLNDSGDQSDIVTVIVELDENDSHYQLMFDHLAQSTGYDGIEISGI